MFSESSAVLDKCTHDCLDFLSIPTSIYVLLTLNQLNRCKGTQSKDYEATSDEQMILLFGWPGVVFKGNSKQVPVACQHYKIMVSI